MRETAIQNGGIADGIGSEAEVGAAREGEIDHPGDESLRRGAGPAPTHSEGVAARKPISALAGIASAAIAAVRIGAREGDAAEAGSGSRRVEARRGGGTDRQHDGGACVGSPTEE